VVDDVHAVARVAENEQWLTPGKPPDGALGNERFPLGWRQIGQKVQLHQPKACHEYQVGVSTGVSGGVSAAYQSLFVIYDKSHNP
jgi:hypothetical protein